MTWSIAPVQPATVKKGSTRQQPGGRKTAPDGFLAVLEEMGGVTRQDGFSSQGPPRQQAEKEREMDVLQRRIQHVNRLLLSFMAVRED